MRRYPSREQSQALLQVTEYCGRHNRRYRCWTLRGGKLVAQGCYQCEQAEQRQRAEAEEARRG